MRQLLAAGEDVAAYEILCDNLYEIDARPPTDLGLELRRAVVEAGADPSRADLLLSSGHPAYHAHIPDEHASQLPSSREASQIRASVAAPSAAMSGRRLVSATLPAWRRTMSAAGALRDEATNARAESMTRSVGPNRRLRARRTVAGR